MCYFLCKIGVKLDAKINSLEIMVKMILKETGSEVENILS